jgi:abortive infection bacteriophage resistance protein
MQLKKSKTYKEQVEILRNKGLKINDSGNVISFLNHVNYYRFSGYFLPFISKTDKKFHEDTSFEQLENIYYFDSDLRNKCAHYSRLYYWIFTALPRMPQGEKYIPTRRLFAQLYMLKLMYPDHKKWNEEFVKPLAKLMRKYKSDIVMAHIDFPYKWKSMLMYK